MWLLLAPRDYLSTFLKLGVVALLAIAIVIMHPVLKMPAITQFVDGTGPFFSGKVFPFVFITIACGAISGFHALVSSGTTPKLITNETDVRLVGYGSMALESFVGIMAMIAATLLDPGVYFAINTGAGVVGAAADGCRGHDLELGLPGHRRADAGPRQGDGREHAVRPHRRRAFARGRHGQHLRHELRPRPA